MPNANVQFALNLPPKLAIEFLKGKKANVARFNEQGFLDSARARATVIANLSSLEMTNDLYQSLIEAKTQGKTFAEWKTGMLAVFKQKGWLSYDKELKDYLIADPKTGEYFGTPRRLGLIYRTNMQAAYSAQRYQQLRENADNRPYWQYSSVNDSRTRPSHSAMHGLIFRYDDPFWATFYPPNGFNCRCTVIALSEREIQRKQAIVSDGEQRLVSDVMRSNDNSGNKTTGFKLFDDRVVVTDKGFDYNIGKQSYRPNLDLYPEALAHQFAKREMASGEFQWAFSEMEKALTKLKADKGLTGKLTAEQMLAFRNKMSRNFKFTAGVLSQETKQALQANTATVWLSDDTLIKQVNSREGQDFGLDVYADLPEILNSPERVISGKDYHYSFYKQVKGKKLMAVLKVLGNEREIFLQSFRLLGDKEWLKAIKSR